MTRVKVCGITSVGDARLAVEAGASAIGLVFWARSPRAVTAAQARAITAVLPPFVQAIGVFVDAAPDEAAGIAEAARLDAVQLHGDEAVEVWRDFGRPIVKALTLDRFEGSPWMEVARAVLLDAHDPERRGGTGVTIDWERAGAIARRYPIILAGGLTADNVADAIGRVRPAALDVSSGVEQAPGVKAPDRLRAFFDAVRQADARTGVADPLHTTRAGPLFKEHS